MPQKCETISYCNPAPDRDPRQPSANLQPVWKVTTMHLKPYPKLQKKELHLESGQDCSRGLRVDQQGVLRTEWGVRQTCALVGSPSDGTANRCPLGVLSTNTLRGGGGGPVSRVGGGVPGPWVRKSKGSSSVATFTSSLVLLSSSTGLENEGGALRIGQDGDGALDIWAVIKPGNTKEKIAIFAPQQCSSAGGENRPERERGSPDVRTVPMKIKGCWDGECSVAKRRRRSGIADKARAVADPPAPVPVPSSESRVSPSPESRAGPTALGESAVLASDAAEETICRVESEDGEKVVSVVEMVAILEQMASDQQVDSKPLRSSSTITRSKGSSPPEPPPKAPEQPESQEEDGECVCVRVLDMVAKLKFRQSFREGGELSRNNSLRRNVGRVLLAGSEPYSAPAPPAGPQDARAESPSEGPASHLDKPDGTSSPHLEGSGMVRLEAGGDAEPRWKPVSPPEQGGAVGSGPGEEPLPGMLFFPQSPPQPLQALHRPPLTAVAPRARAPEASPKAQDCEPAGAPRAVPAPLSAPPAATDRLHEEEGEGCAPSREPVPFPLRRLVSHEFLEVRFKIQLLLEPQQYLAFLPHHVIVKIFCLLPTESLAALKCTCHYFKFIIESYGVRPADSRWVCDPRYRDDPCKQCKRRYGRGDVSLCRWHHKPYCQALPYGPGYWMCCHGSRRSAPGCNVGLHDNRWVPAFHSINVPIYKKSREAAEEDS